MSVSRFLFRRIALGVASAWLVFTGVFALFTLSQDWALGARLGMAGYAGADEEELEHIEQQYIEERGLDGAWYEMYVEWLWSLVTLDWGDSFETGEPALTVVTDAVVTTATYVIPAVVVAVVLGTVLGMLVSFLRGSGADGATRALVYLAFGIPSYWVAAFLMLWIVGDAGELMFTEERRLFVSYEESPATWMQYGLASALVATILLAGQVSYARAYSLEYLSAEYVTLVRAKGAGAVDVVRHVLRNISLPLVSLVFTEMIGLLVLAVFVLEMVLGIEGIGALLLDALWERDLPVIYGSIAVIITAVIAGNIVQDLSYRYLDPRVGEDAG